MHSFFRNWALGCAASVLTLAAFLPGCSKTQPSSSTANVEREAKTATGNIASQAVRPETAAPKIDADAINANGEIVLEASGPSLNASNSADPNANPSAEQLAESPAIAPPSGDAAAPSVGQTAATTAANPTLASSTSSIVKSEKTVPVEANVATDAERNQKIAEDWPQPQAVIFVSGQQHGYLEPCGCTGLDKQKGGLIRRDTLLADLKDRGWELVPVDVGNQVRRTGRQPELKFQATVEAFKLMDYKAATLGVDDLKLSSIELIQAAGSPGPFICANVTVIDPSFFPPFQVVEAGGRKIGITAILGKQFENQIQTGDVELADPVESLLPVVKDLQAQGCDFIVLLAHASIEESAEVARQVPGFDLVATAGGFGEPTLHPEPIEGSKAVMVQVGVKGMYGGIVGLFDDAETPLRYQKIAISSQFEDSPRMLELFTKYQNKLKDAGFKKLGATLVAHPTSRQFVGSETCGDCHTTAYEIWQNSPHVHATDSIVAPPNDRGGIARHFDPECVSCHVTGWNAQEFYPFTTGYESLEHSEHLLGSGCENCHGPGKDHVDAENGDIEADNDMLLKLRQQMVLKLENARERCMDCHDLDNSPDFHEEGAFDRFWEQVKHYGKD